MRNFYSKLRAVGPWFHYAALVAEVAGTTLVFLEARRILAQLRAAGHVDYSGGAPHGFTAWYYDAGGPGFALLLIGIVLTGAGIYLDTRDWSPSRREQGKSGDAPKQLCEAALATLRGDKDALGRAFEELKPDTRTFVQAYVLCFTESPYQGSEAVRLVLLTLQYYMEEKSAKRLNRLTIVIAVLTAVLLVVTVIDVFRKLSGAG